MRWLIRSWAMLSVTVPGVEGVGGAGARGADRRRRGSRRARRRAAHEDLVLAIDLGRDVAVGLPAGQVLVAPAVVGRGVGSNAPTARLAAVSVTEMRKSLVPMSAPTARRRAGRRSRPCCDSGGVSSVPSQETMNSPRAGVAATSGLSASKLDVAVRPHVGDAEVVGAALVCGGAAQALAEDLVLVHSGRVVIALPHHQVLVGGRQMGDRRILLRRSALPSGPMSEMRKSFVPSWPPPWPRRWP